MPNNLDLNSNQTSVIASTADLIANVANQAVVRPMNDTNINGFLFDFVGEEEITLESDITDHYVEDNYAIQDHIAQKPIRFIAKGYIGEIFNIFPSSVLSILTTIQSLSAVPGLQPVFSAQANQVYNQLSEVGDAAVNVITQAKSVASLLNGSSTTANKQQNAYATFLNFWQSRIPCYIETPWVVLFNMYVERVTPSQPENTNVISEFTVSFKQLRFASTLTATPLTITNLAGTGVKTPADIFGAFPGQTNLPQNITSGV